MPCRSIAVAVLVLALTACRRDGSSSAGNPTAETELPAPRPILSRFTVPLDYDFTPVLAIVERAVPKTFGSIDSVKQAGDDTRRHYAFEATRSPFTVFVDGSMVHLHATLAYQARGYYKPVIGPTIQAGCGSAERRPKIVVELVTPVSLDSTWHLRSRVRLKRVAPASESGDDRCRVSVLRFDVTDRVMDAAREGLTSQLPEIDRRIRAVSLAGEAAGWWTTLNRPIRLRDEVNVFLLLQPERLRVGKVTGSGQTLTIQAGIDAYPLIVTGIEPSATTRPLPPLGVALDAQGFNIVLDGYLDYGTASKTLTEVLRGKSVTVKGRTVAVDSIVASGKSGGRLAMGVIFSGDARGTLQLVGTPQHDRVTREISVPDLDYDLETNNLIEAVAWVKSDDLRTMMREKARIPVAPVLERGKELLTSGLNRTIGTDLKLAATVDSVAVLGLFVRRPGIVVRAGAMGNAQVSVRQNK